MGSGLQKDKNIDVYVQTSKDLYVAGQWVQGAVYINSHQHTSYTQLVLKLECWEQCIWSDQSHIIAFNYQNKVCSYSERFLLNNFGQSGISQGHYTFPFKILLPQGLPGSFKQDEWNFIGYSLIAELTPVNNSGQKLYPQSFQTPLNIDEPLRIPFGLISEERINKPKCCETCCSYGTVRSLLSCDKNFIRPGDNIKLKAHIDNSNGKKNVKNIVFKLERNITAIQREGGQRTETQEQLVLFQSEKGIPKGAHDTIQFQKTIPLNYSAKSTAIGTVISNFFTLRISSSIGCCSQAVDSQVHLVYHSSNRKIEQAKKVSAPLGWNPKLAQPAILNNLKPYIYKPQGDFRWYNRAFHPGIMNAGNLQYMGSNEALHGPSTINRLQS